VFLEGALAEFFETHGSIAQEGGGPSHPFVSTLYDEAAPPDPRTTACGLRVSDVKCIWIGFVEKVFQNWGRLNVAAGVDYLFAALKAYHEDQSTPWKSLFYKQLGKQRLAPVTDESFWKQCVVGSLEKAITGFASFNLKLAKKNRFANAAHRRTVSMVIFCTLASLVDIYTIARILKRPGGGTAAPDACKLALCFFGHAHIQGMKDILDKLGYGSRTVKEYSTKGRNRPGYRCIQINTHIDVTEMLTGGPS
jgi:hypothetical protein